MSGLAEILHDQHFTISGSDAKESALTKHLAEKGMQIFYGQTADNIIPGIDLVVYTAAIAADNPEFSCAKEKGIPTACIASLGMTWLCRGGFYIRPYKEKPCRKLRHGILITFAAAGTRRGSYRNSA